MSKKNIGSNFDDFLKEEATLEGATAVALRRVIAWQIGEEMKAQQMTKTELAKRMHTSRAALNRLLDEADPSLTLTTLASAAAALGKTVNIQFAPAWHGGVAGSDLHCYIREMHGVCHLFLAISLPTPTPFFYEG